MNLQACRARLEASALAIDALLSGVSDEQARWRPAEGHWSIVEVAMHLADEEQVDFRRRLDLTLHHPEQDWPGIDPEALATERCYREQHLGATLERFREERARSVAWLGALENPDWAQAHTHPRLGPITAGDLLGAWVAHDLLHLRQLTRILFQWTERVSEPHSVAYAGNW